MIKYVYSSEQKSFVVTEVNRLRGEGYTLADATSNVLLAFHDRYDNYTGNVQTILGLYNRLVAKRSPDVQGRVRGKVVVEEKDKQWCQVFDTLDEAIKSVNGSLAKYTFYEASPIKIKTKTVYAIERG